MRKIITVFILLISICSAEEMDNDFAAKSFIAQQILETQPDAVSHCTEDRLYLRPEKISLGDRGLFVGSLQIPTLYSDASGCYVEATDKSGRSWICATSYCPNFRNIFRSKTGNCPECGRKGIFYE